MTNDPDAGSVIAAADAAGAPLSELSRLLMHHEPAMTVTVPDWVADRVICAALIWGVTEPVAGAWLLAEGTSRLVRAAEADRLDFLTDKIPGLDITNPDSAPHCRQLHVQAPGAGDCSLRWDGWPSWPKLTCATSPRSASRGDWPGCITPKTDTTAATSRLRASSPDPNQPMVLRWARTRRRCSLRCSLEQLALSLLAPKQILAVALPAFVDDWLVCIARRWQSTESTTAVWLLAEGAGYLYALEDKGDTDWRTGPNRWVIPEGPTGPSAADRDARRVAADHRGLAGISPRRRPDRHRHPRGRCRCEDVARRSRLRLRPSPHTGSGP